MGHAVVEGLLRLHEGAAGELGVRAEAHLAEDREAGHPNREQAQGEFRRFIFDYLHLFLENACHFFLGRV